MDKIKISMDQLQDPEFKLPEIEAVPCYIGFQKCYECAEKIVKESMVIHDGYTVQSPYWYVNEYFHIFSYLSSYDLSEVDTSEGHVLFYDKIYQAGEDWKRETFSKLNAYGSWNDISSICESMQTAVCEAYNPIRVLAESIGKVASAMTTSGPTVTDAGELQAAAEKLINVIDYFNRINVQAEPSPKTKIMALNFSKKY